MERHEPMSVGKIIEDAISATGNRDEYSRQQACFLWQEVVGPEINRQTFHRYVERDVMHVYISSASLKNELRFHIPALVQKINQAVGSNVITDIVLH